MWRGDLSLPPSKQGLKILGVPVGHPEYIVRELAQKIEEQSLLFGRIPLVEDVQAAWLLLTFCAATRANFWLRTVPREFTQGYARQERDQLSGADPPKARHHPAYLGVGFHATDFRRLGSGWSIKDM